MNVIQSIRVAHSEAEFESIFRFRYRVFAELLGRYDLDGADHQAKRLNDSLDPGSFHFYAGETGSPLAAVTMTPLGEQSVPFALAAFLDLEQLAGAVPLERVVLANWLLVDPAIGGSAVVTSLMTAIAERALADRAELVLTFCRPGLVNFYERLGFEQYKHATDLKGIGLRCPLLFVLRDEARLKAVRSPFLRLLRRAGVGGNEAVRLKLEPLIDLFQASQILVNDGLWIETGVKFTAPAQPRLFDGLPEESIRHIMKQASVISCKQGEIITRLGETSDDMFLVAAGQFTGFHGTTGATRRLSEGDLFGEVEHLTGSPRVEKVVAATSGHIAALKAEVLFNWMRHDPDHGVALSINLARLLACRVAVPTIDALA